MKMKKKGYAMGGATKMKKKGYAKGGLKMVKNKDGKMVPHYAADGVGKMNKGGMTKKKPDMMGVGMYGGGMTKKKKGYAKGGVVMCGASNPAERPMKKSS